MAQPMTPAPPQPPQYGMHTVQQQAQLGAQPPLKQPAGMAAPLLAPVPMGMNEPLHVPRGRPVSELMPQVAPVSSLTDSYSNFQYTAESSSEAGRTHAATWDAKSGVTDAASFSAPVPMGQPVFYSDEQMALLNQQLPPPEIFYYGLKSGVRPEVAQPLPTVTGAPIATDAHVAMARPVLTTASGVPVVVASSAGLSGARTAFDGMQGIKSCDERLQTSVDELLLFFNTHNSRPLVGCAVEGWHHETRHRRVRVEDGDGKHHYKTETYVEKVTDFQYKIDLTSFVYPFGYIVSVDENKLSVPQLCQKFVDDENLLKSLQMTKEVHFDFKQLDAMVHGYIRSLGWWRGLTVSFPQANHSLRVYNENMLSEMWEDRCCNILPDARVHRAVHPHAPVPRRLPVPDGPRRGRHPQLLSHQLCPHPGLRSDPKPALVPGLLGHGPSHGDPAQCLLVRARGRKAWMAGRGEPGGAASTTEPGGLSITPRWALDHRPAPRSRESSTGSCGTRQFLQLHSVWLYWCVL